MPAALTVPTVAAAGTLVAILVAAILFVAWIATLFALVLDELGVGEKLVWIVLVTLLAPLAMTVYWVLRLRRRRPAA